MEHRRTPSPLKKGTPADRAMNVQASTKSYMPVRGGATIVPLARPSMQCSDCNGGLSGLDASCSQYWQAPMIGWSSFLNSSVFERISGIVVPQQHRELKNAE